METELRRKQISLYTLGTGIILFGAWSVVKALLIVQAKPIGLRLYIGLSARAEGTGGKKKYFYLHLSVVIFLINILAFLFSLYSLLTNRVGDYDTLDYIVTLLVDLTSNFLLARLIFTVRRVRKLRKLSEG